MRILGIDLGSTSIKAVEVDSAFGRYEIHDYHEQKLEHDTEPMQALARLMKGLPKAPDRIAVALKTSQLTFRSLQLPTRDKKAILAGVGFELDDDLPFPLERSVYDYSILAQTGQTTNIHIAVTLKQYVAEVISRLAGADVDPDMVTSEGWAYRTLFNRMLSQQAQEKPVLLLQIGHHRTLMYVQWRGFPILSREYSWGGLDLTTALCRKYEIPLQQAETTKIDHAFVLPPSQEGEATQEQKEFSAALLESLETLVMEVKQVALATKNLTHESLSGIHLSGGTSLLPGLARFLEEKLRMPVRPLQALSAISTSGVTYSEHTDATFSLAASLALCYVGTDRASAINLRKGDLAKMGRSKEMNVEALRRPIMATGAVLASMILSLMVQSSLYRSRISGVDTQLEKSVRSFYSQVSGQISNSAVKTYMSNTSTLRTSVSKELGKQRETAKLLGPNPHSPVNFLKQLSAAVPKDVIVDMTQFQVGAAPDSAYGAPDPGAVSLTFLMANQQSADRLSSLLGSKISGLQKSTVDEVVAPDGNGKRWKVTFTGKPVEDAYGN